MQSTASVRAAKTGYIILSGCICAFGMILALRPGLSLDLITDLAGIILICFGVVKLWGYLSKDMYRLAFQHGLATGLLAIAVGLVLLFRSRVMLSVLCVILGITALLDGLTKIEMSIDAKAFGLRSWWLTLLVGVLAGIVGFLLVLHPWDGAETMVSLLGWALFLEGVLNLLTALTSIKVQDTAPAARGL